MDWVQTLTFLIGNFAFMFSLWFWQRAESRADHRHLETTVSAFLKGIQEEMKDFHGRLCAIEEKNKKS